MRYARVTPLLAAFALTSTMISAQAPSEPDIAAAIKLGQSEKINSLFVVCAVGPSFGQSMASGMVDAGGTWPLGYYTIELSTNVGMIAAASQQAKRKYLTYSRTDVTEDLLQPWIRVGVLPHEPTQSGGKINIAPPLTHVVLKSKSKDGTVVQPTKLDIKPVQWTLGGNTSSGTTAIARFGLDAVKALSGPFEVIVVTSGGERKCGVDDGARKRLKLTQDGK